MTLQQLRDFLAVVEHGSFRAAARAQDVSQAGLTNSLKALEAGLGSLLLVRSARGVLPTAAGERLLQRARLIDAEAQRAVEEARSGAGAAGTLRVGFSPTPSALLLPAVVPPFRARHAGAQLHVAGGLFERLAPAVREGQLDFAVLSLPAAGFGKDLRAQPLMEAEMAVVGRRAHPLARSRRLAGLATADWIQMGPAFAPGGTIFQFFAQAGLPPPRIAVACDSFTQVSALLAGSDYLALLPRLMLERQLLGSGLAEIALAERAPLQPIALLQRAEVPLTPLAQALAAMLRSAARSLGQLPGQAA